MTSRGESDAFFAKWSVDGVYEWLRSEGTPSYDFVFHGAELADGSVAAGSGISFRDEAVDLVLWGIDEDGTITRRTVGPVEASGWYAPLAGDDSHFFSVHSLADTLALSAALTVSSTGAEDALIVAWDRELEPVWSSQSSGAGSDFPTGLAMQGDDGLVVVGGTRGSSTFGAATSAAAEDSGFFWSLRRR